jgi:hypothetical protein
MSDGSLLSGNRHAASLLVRVTAGIQEAFVEDVVLEFAFHSFLFPTFVQINFVVIPLTFDVLTAPILLQALPEVAASVLVFENEKSKSAETEILRIFDILKQYQERLKDIGLPNNQYLGGSSALIFIRNVPPKRNTNLSCGNWQS